MRTRQTPLLLKYEFFNIARGKWLIIYGLFFMGFTEALLQFGQESNKIVLSLLSLILLIIPLVAGLFSCVYWYSSDNFTLLLLTQPLSRQVVYFARWLALSLVLSLIFIVGVSIPLIFHETLGFGVLIVLCWGVILTCIFSSLGLFLSSVFEDKLKGVGMILILCFYFAIIHDGIVFLILATFQDYPLEMPAMILTAINPISVARVSTIMSLDTSAVMGYTGTVVQHFFSDAAGYAAVILAAVFWIVCPLVVGMKKFKSRDY